jgi:hypothetical protein
MRKSLVSAYKNSNILFLTLPMNWLFVTKNNKYAFQEWKKKKRNEKETDTDPIHI